MKHTALILLLAASTMAASAQAPAKPPAPAAKPAVTAAKPALAAASAPATKAVAANSPTIAAVIKAPAGIPPVQGIQKPIFTVTLRYQEIKIGTGAVAEPKKMYKVLYTGWRAADGVKFDSSDDHRAPLRDKDGKPVMGDDGNPKLGDPQPMPFPQGMGSTIPGFDQGFAGMKVGGKRRIFIPWQMAYGTRTIPDRDPNHPGIPAKSDLIFDIELVDVSEMPQMPAHPPMGGVRLPTLGAPHPGAPGAPAQPAAPPVPDATPKPPAPPTPAAAPASSTDPAPAAVPKPSAPPAAATAPAPSATSAAPTQSQPK